MIFQHTYEWILGVSPHTKQPKTMTSRIFRSVYEFDGIRVWNKDTKALVYAPHRRYSIQPARGKKGVGFIEIDAITYDAFNTITHEIARKEGFADVASMHELWMQMYGRIEMPVLRLSFHYIKGK